MKLNLSLIFTIILLVLALSSKKEQISPEVITVLELNHDLFSEWGLPLQTNKKEIYPCFVDGIYSQNVNDGVLEIIEQSDNRFHCQYVSDSLSFTGTLEVFPYEFTEFIKMLDYESYAVTFGVYKAKKLIKTGKWGVVLNGKMISKTYINNYKLQDLSEINCK